MRGVLMGIVLAIITPSVLILYSSFILARCLGGRGRRKQARMNHDGV